MLMIFEDDGYRAVDPSVEQLKLGDLVTYWGDAQKHSEFYHVGMIFELKRGVTHGSPPIPLVLSKWDSRSGEFLHIVSDYPFLDDVPFLERANYKVEIEYWTDRPGP